MSQEIFGSNSSGQSQQQATSQSGFALLPPEIQQAFKDYASKVSNTFGSDQSSNFTLPSLAPGAQSALTSIENQAYAPTATSINNDVTAQTNPYDQNVIDTINREAAGQGSQLKAATTAAGQSMGSNRMQLGANDIDLSRLQQIGNFKQGEFQQAMNNAINVLPQLRMQSAGGALSAGQTQQQMDYLNKQAPYGALSMYGSLLGVLPNTGGSTSQSTGSSQQQSGSGFGMFGEIG